MFDNLGMGVLSETVGSDLGAAGGSCLPAIPETIGTRDRPMLKVTDALGPLLPLGAIPGGSVVSVTGVGACSSLALALVAGASRDGAWVAAVGMEHLGLAAAEEMGVCLDRFVLVRDEDPSRRPMLMSTLLDAFSLVIVPTGPSVRARKARTRTWGQWMGADGFRRVSARVRERGSVAVLIDGPGGEASSLGYPSPDRVGASGGERGFLGGSDLVLRVLEASWTGPDEGHGALQHRQVEVEITGRRAASRPRRGRLLLPGPSGEVCLAASGEDGADARQRAG